MDKGNKEDYIPVGTAFLVDDNGLNVLVTCRHVVKGTDLSKLFFSFNTLNKEIERISFPELKMGYEFINWVFHKNKNIDIAAIPFPMRADRWDTRKIGKKYYSTYNKINEGDEIFFLGFPLGIKSLQKIRPLVRYGIVSFKYEEKIFLIDALVYPGNSGSPVYLKPELLKFEKKEKENVAIYSIPYLVGIISSYIPYIDPCYSAQTKRVRITFEENSGLANVFSLDLILEIFQLEKFQEMRSELVSRVGNSSGVTRKKK